MANPFSGLENIGQSYLQGVQLANQRQAREEALAQRQEEARVRGQYYQDLVDQRREAAALAAQNRNDVLGSKFGEYLTLNTDGSVNIVESSRKLKEAEGTDAFAETAGLAQGLGTPITGITPEISKSKAFQRGLANAMVEKTKNQIQMDRIMASQGIIAAGPGRSLPAAVENAVTGQEPQTVFDILSGRGETAGPAVADQLSAPPGTIPIRMNDRDYFMRKPKAEKPAKTEYPGEIEMDTPEGPMKIKLTAEQVASRLAQQKSAAPTNAPVKVRFQRDPVTGKLVLAK